jgi:tRNA A37 threonylcarbamoyladenosine biosynthesis protein TsaE
MECNAMCWRKPLHKINRARGIGAEKLNAYWRDFYTVWGNSEVVAEEVISISGIVVVEWPEANDYR